MASNYWKISILAVGVLAGILIVFQFKTQVPIESDFPADELQAHDELKKDFLDEQAFLQSRIVTLRNQVVDMQNAITDQSEAANLEELNNLKKIVGLTEVIGPGVEITLDDSPLVLREGANPSEEQLIQAADLRDVVNLLYAANADAIAVNNQRILATSPISSVGTTILVNDTYIAPPFIVQAVGDPEIIAQRMLSTSLLPSLYERKQKAKIKFQIIGKQGILIPIYNAELKTKYLNLIE